MQWSPPYCPRNNPQVITQYSADMMACCSVMIMAIIMNDHNSEYPKKDFLFFLTSYFFFLFHPILQKELHMLKQECTSVFAERWSTPEIDPSRTLSEPESEFNVSSIPVGCSKNEVK